MNIPAKLFHIFKQALIFLILPFVVFASNFRKSCEHCFPCNYFIRQSQIPVNRFLYWEMSKLLFYAIVMATLVDETDYTWYDMITILWIASNLLETFRTIHRYILSLSATYRIHFFDSIFLCEIITFKVPFKRKT